ncbi:hypothetical protein [Paenibacillus hexagrammi]|uniref:Uncharacterized protein n=1 Tax=Paenibacillus hexagrammi TaxID=2908839 RepID=A0ABY3SN99_9BACL|nr:hypothetical protein [Paenibacillus sp. YPD9-1]UJF34467.1 hypothetical protein L0M14_04555 [Paenibacillus sp. YPD9-1]
MKIAYVNEIPGDNQLQMFIQAYTNKFDIPDCKNVISVYDEQDLIGIGSMKEDIEVHVLPAYRHREIEGNVCKLLKAELKFSTLLHK